MDVTRMSIARVLELGVPISWREAAAVVFEGVSTAHDPDGRAMSRVAPATCLITRGGEVVFSDDFSCRDPEDIAGLAADLLTACPDRGDLGAALDAGRLLPFLEKLGEDTTWKRRRVQIAALALRALAAEADRAVADNGDATNAAETPGWPGATTLPAQDLVVAAATPGGVRRFTRRCRASATPSSRPTAQSSRARSSRRIPPRTRGGLVDTRGAAGGRGVAAWRDARRARSSRAGGQHTDFNRAARGAAQRAIMEAGDLSHRAVAATDMDSTRISLARVLGAWRAGELARSRRHRARSRGAHGTHQRRTTDARRARRVSAHPWW